MAHKRVLTIQDISCVGQCSATVALPVLSACGLETCLLPTAVLSTHTGGFSSPVVQHMTDSLKDICLHWVREGIRFDAIYTGYLGSTKAISVILEMVDVLLAPDGILIVDPAMADHGKLYKGFDLVYVSEMKKLCLRADMILPNMTEAAMLTDTPYCGDCDMDYGKIMTEKMPQKGVILTGVSCAEGQTGALVRWDHKYGAFSQPQIDGNYSGTGDLFAACFTGALLQGKSVFQAAEIAVQITALCVRNTWKNPAHAYGIQFESVLPELIQMVQQG